MRTIWEKWRLSHGGDFMSVFYTGRNIGRKVKEKKDNLISKYR